MALLTEGLLGWRPPWEPGGIVFPHGQPPIQRHVFLEALRGKEPDFSRLAGAFEAITPARLEEYYHALPPQWIGDGQAVKRILDYIAQLQEKIEDAILQLRSALQ